MEKDRLSYAEVSRIERRNVLVNAGALLGAGGGLAAFTEGVINASPTKIVVGAAVAGASAGIRYLRGRRNRQQ